MLELVHESGPLFVASPSSPSSLYPQPYTAPAGVSPKLSSDPSGVSWPSALTAVNVTPAGSCTASGTSLLVVVPLPNWPSVLSPQAYIAPVEVSARPQ
jgi:hypothetical protein